MQAKVMTFKNFLLERYNSGCLMVEIEPEEKIREIQKEIPDEILLKDKTEDNGDIIHGLQMSLHITISYGLEDNMNLNEITDIINKYKMIELEAKTVDNFIKDEFSVAHLAVTSPDIFRIHHLIRQNYEIEHDFNTFKPHITLAYLKPGMTFQHEFEPFKLRTGRFIFSKADGDHILI